MTDREIEEAADSIADFCDRRADRDAASKEIVALVNRAILAERERCAKVCEEIENAAWKDWKAAYKTYDEGRSDGAGECAAFIRDGA